MDHSLTYEKKTWMAFIKYDLIRGEPSKIFTHNSVHTFFLSGGFSLLQCLIIESCGGGLVGCCFWHQKCPERRSSLCILPLIRAFLAEYRHSFFFICRGMDFCESLLYMLLRNTLAFWIKICKYIPFPKLGSNASSRFCSRYVKPEHTSLLDFVSLEIRISMSKKN